MNHYPSYKNTNIEWVDDIPEHWETKRIKNLFNESLEQNWNKECSFYLSVLKDIGVIPYTEKGNIGNKISSDTSNYRLVKKNDIVVNTTNVCIGSVGISKYDGCLSSVMYIILRPQEEINSNYYDYIFKLRRFQGHLRKISNGILEVREYLNKTLFKVEPLPEPPLVEQTQIVSFLDIKTKKIDELIEKTEQKIKLLKEKRTSLINHCVTKGLNPNVEMKDSGVEWIGEIPFHWKINSLWRLTEEIKVGLCTSVTKHYRDIGTPIIRNLNIKSGYFDGSKMLYLNEQFSEKEKSKKVKNGDVLTVHTGSNLGLSCIVPSEFDNSHTFTTLITTTQKNKLNNEYLVYLINSEYGKSEVSILKRGFGKDNLNVKEFKYFKTIEIPLSEQSQIVEYLDEQTQKIDSTIEKETQRIELLKEYRQSLISEVVTGKVDVRDWKE